jgi:hypothetical protein
MYCRIFSEQQDTAPISHTVSGAGSHHATSDDRTRSAQHCLKRRGVTMDSISSSTRSVGECALTIGTRAKRSRIFG